MNKKETLEIKKQFTNENCAITRICGCYVDAEKQIRTELKEAFLSLPEEEMFKYFEIFRKTLSGTLGRNLINLEFPLEQEMPDGTQAWLLKLRNSRLTDDLLLDEFYEKIINSYVYGENYYIILIHAAYDIPKRAEDGLEMFDASDDTYEYLLCSICPVKLSKAGLCYNAEKNSIEDRIRDWIVEMPITGFLFPAFNDRNTDLHSMLYYTKNPESLQPILMEEVFGCETPLSAKEQKETFGELLSGTLGDACDYETVISIHENLNELIEEKKDLPEPPTLSKLEVKNLLVQSGASDEVMEHFEEQFDQTAGENTSFLATNLTSAKTLEVRTPDVVVKIAPEKAALMETRVIDGCSYLLIQIDDYIEVNGVAIKAGDTD
ncbi:MAG: DUF4317 domain-containing protein [Lachnospiraceae bacterium]|nr:DUF4317 domain-containing protein [Lachnospiraceae bacterium]